MSAAAKDFLDRHQLPATYLESAQRWFEPLIQQFCDQYQPDTAPQILGINGCQGSGKSTLADYLCTMIAERQGIQTVSLSMDDFYLTLAERRALAKTVHPLLSTRGVPGTHDVALSITTIEHLRSGPNRPIPGWDRSIDDRVTGPQIKSVSGPVGLIILEGWCLGAIPEPDFKLAEPINCLERLEDQQAIWRQYINQALSQDYQQLFAMVDQLIMLQAPSFDTVFDWRLEQEAKMRNHLKAADSSGVMDEQQLGRFIQHFQRITEHSLREMPQRAQHLFKLGSDRQISQYQQR